MHLHGHLCMPPLVVICHIFPCFRPPNVPSSRTVQFLAPFINPARIPPFFPLLPDVGHRWTALATNYPSVLTQPRRRYHPCRTPHDRESTNPPYRTHHVQ